MGEMEVDNKTCHRCFLERIIRKKTSETHQVSRTTEICWFEKQKVRPLLLTAHTEHKFVAGATVRFMEPGLETEER